MQDFSGEIVPLKNDSPLKYCPLVSFDDDDTDDGFLDIMDQEVAQVIKHCITESLVIKWVFKNNLSNLHIHYNDIDHASCFRLF